MSKRARFAPIPAFSHCINPDLDLLDWGEWADRAGFRFTKQARAKIEDALNLLYTEQRCIEGGLLIKFEDMRKRVRAVKDRLSKGHPADDVKACDYIEKHTFGEPFVGKSLKERADTMLRLMKECPNDVSMELPRSEAMALFLIQEAFEILGVRSKPRHTYPTTIEEGNEPISAFEDFCFTYVLKDIGRGPNERKILYRRLKEASDAQEKAQRKR